MLTKILFSLFIESVVCTNYALNKLVFMSDSDPSANPEVVVDGDVSTCQTMNGGTLFYFTIDLKEFIKVESFQFTANPTEATSITVEVLQFDPFITPRDPCSCMDNVTLQPSYSSNCSTICSGRYIYIRSDDDQMFSLCEFQVFGSLNESLRTEAVYQLRSPFTIRMPSAEVRVATPRACAEQCANRTYCVGFNFRKQEPTADNCGLLDRVQGETMNFESEKWVYYSLSNALYCY